MSTKTACIERSKYAESIIGDHASEYDATEVMPVVYLPECDAYEVCDRNDPYFAMWSTYVHCVAGGVECVGDFETEADALEYAKELDEKYGWKDERFIIKQLVRGEWVARFFQGGKQIRYSSRTQAAQEIEQFLIRCSVYPALQTGADLPRAEHFKIEVAV